MLLLEVSFLATPSIYQIILDESKSNKLLDNVNTILSPARGLEGETLTLIEDIEFEVFVWAKIIEVIEKKAIVIKDN